MAAYASILFRRLLVCIIFLGNDLYSFVFYIKVFIYFPFVWVRGTVPRFRCDKLMHVFYFPLMSLSLQY
jgi:NADH-ubiquinone oxidoreductase chain 1